MLLSSAKMKDKLRKLCDGQHEHEVLEGNRTKKAQQWPKELCQAILEGALAELKSQVICHAFPAEFEIEDNETTGHLDGVQDLDDIAEQVHKRRRIDFDALDTEEDHEQGQDAAVEVLLHEKERQRKQKWLKISREQRVAIRRIHQMMGHCSNQALVRMLVCLWQRKRSLKQLSISVVRVAMRSRVMNDPAQYDQPIHVIR